MKTTGAAKSFTFTFPRCAALVLTATFMLTNAACRSSPANGASNRYENQKPMEYQLDRAAFDLPATLRDITLYTFGKPDRSQLVEINASEREATLDQLTAEISDQAVEGLGLTLADRRDTKIDDLPARVLTFVGEERGETFRQFFVLAVVPSSSASRIRHLEIKYLTKENAETANAKLERMIKSVRRTSAAPTAAVSEGFTRHFAGVITLDLPADLQGGGFQFTLLEDGAAITGESVTFEVSEVHDATAAALNQTNANAKQTAAENPSEEAEMEADIAADLNSGGQILERATKDVAAAGFKGKVLSYAVNNAPPWEKQPKNKLVRRAYLQVSGGSEVRIVGRADSQKREILEQNFNQILNSVRKK